MATASSSSSSITHITELNGDENLDHFQDNTSRFKTMRVTIHTTGAWPNSPHSDNHVTILLLLRGEEDGKAIQIDMRTDPNDRRGQLVWKKVDYQQSLSEIVHFDCKLDRSVEVGTLYKAIRYDWAYHRYLFSAGGSGCHYWKYKYAIETLFLNTDLF
jgi:hypothetical protein